MRLRLELESSGRLHCELEDGTQNVAFSAYDGAASLAVLRAASEDLQRDGVGECFWQMARGEYRLLFRRIENDKVRIVVLWANGTVTGWEHVFWTECPYPVWQLEVSRELAQTLALP